MSALFHSPKIRVAVCALALLVFSSCQDTYNEFCTQYPVTFSCDITFAPYNIVCSMGQFISIRLKADHSSCTIYNPSLGQTTEQPLSEIEARSFVFGLGGLIIGQPYFNDGTSTYYAYDLACPHCERASARLALDALGQAHCERCDAVFDLNNGGIVVQGEGRPLYRYRVTQSTVSTLYVHN